jgi:hypothetical protein
MEMGEEHGIDLGGRHHRLGELGPGPGPCVDDDHMAAGDDRGAGIGAFGIEHRRSRTAQ